MLGLLDQSVDFSPESPLDAKALPAHGGAYLISDGDDAPVLLAHAESLRRVVQSRLAEPAPDKTTKRVNLAEIARRIRWRETHSRFETAWVHWRAARALYPRSYRKLLGFGPAWFLHVAPAEAAPRFETVKSRKNLDGRLLGPFATRRCAEQWRHTLEDAFDLCRYSLELEKAPNGEACVYFEMGKCPAPCNGTSPMEEYRAAVEGAIRFSLGDREPRLQALRCRMEQAARELAFEKAASLRESLERAAAAGDRPERRHLCEPLQAAWLVIQRGSPRRQTLKNTLARPFFVRSGVITTDSPVSLADIGPAVEAWSATVRSGSHCDEESAIDSPAETRFEALWLLSKFLFQDDRAPGLFYRADALPDAGALADAVTAKFAG